MQQITHPMLTSLLILSCALPCVANTITHQQRVAYHEAGHVIASILLGVEFDYVSTEVKTKKGHFFENGEKVEIEASYTEGIVWSDSRRKELNQQVMSGILDIREAIVAMAGPLAESVLVGKVDEEVKNGATDDEQLIRAACRSAYAHGKPIEEWKPTTLEARLGEAFWQEATILVKRNWRAVEDVARALLDRERLTRQEAEVIVRDRKNKN